MTRHYFAYVIFPRVQQRAARHNRHNRYLLLEAIPGTLMTTLCGPPVDVQGSGASHRNSEEGHRRGRLLLSYQHHFAACACSCLGCQDNERPLLPGACEHSSELGQARAADDTRRDLHLIVDLLLLLLLLLPDGVNAGLSTMSLVSCNCQAEQVVGLRALLGSARLSSPWLNGGHS